MIASTSATGQDDLFVQALSDALHQMRGAFPIIGILAMLMAMTLLYAKTRFGDGLPLFEWGIASLVVAFGAFLCEIGWSPTAAAYVAAICAGTVLVGGALTEVIVRVRRRRVETAA